MTTFNSQNTYLVLGGGPAGLQLGYHLANAGQDYLVLERGDHVGAFFEAFPRHRCLISINKRFTGSDNVEFNMRHDWNSLLTDDLDFSFAEYDKHYFPAADSIVSYLRDFAERFKINVETGADVASVEKHQDGYVATTADGRRYLGQRLIVATGLFKPFLPDIPGIEHSENYVSMPVDPSGFENQRVLIIGKGNSGFETADNLIAAASVLHIASPESVRMAWKNHYVGSLRAVNNNFLDTYQLKSQNAVIDADIESIEKQDNGELAVTYRYKHAESEVETIRYDRVLCCAGFRVDDSIFGEGAKPELTIKAKYPLLSNEFESRNRQDMFFAGTLTHSLDYRKTTSGFIHGFRYNVKALSHILAKKYDDVPLPASAFHDGPDDLAKLILDRVNVSGGLWQQPGFVADYFFESDDAIQYGKELPIDYITQHLANVGPLYTVTLEYGSPIEGDPFSVSRIHRENIERADSSKFLHPIIRRFDNGTCTHEHHVIEDLESRWEEPVHLRPLTEFLSELIDFEVSDSVYEKKQAAGSA